MNTITTLLPKILKWTELIGIIGAVIGLLLKFSNSSIYDEFLMVGLLTLAGTYFFSSYVFVPGSDSQGKKNLTDLLPTILRKLMYIGLSVYWAAFLFSILHLRGANEMIIIGLGTLVISSFISMALALAKRERMKLLQGPLIRSIVTLCFYFTLPFFR